MASAIPLKVNSTGRIAQFSLSDSIPLSYMGLLTGYVSGAGTVSATDTILQAIQKLNGNDATKATDSAVVHLAGAEAITGAKTFSANVTLGSSIYDATNNRLTFTGASGTSRINLSDTGTTAADGIAFGTTGAIYRTSATIVYHSAVITSLRNTQIENGAGITNAVTGNRGAILFTNPGILITSNIADSSAKFVYQDLHASSTGDLLQLKNSGGTVVSISQKGKLIFDATVTTTGTTGNQTINKAAGTVNIAAGGTSVVVTNNFVTVNSLIVIQLRTNDTTARIANYVAASGSFTINLTAAATSEVSIGFIVFN